MSTDWTLSQGAPLQRAARIPERTEIEYFKGRHSINGQGSFEFLHKHFNWPRVNP